MMAAEARNLRILVIDDNPSIHEDFRKILGPRPDGGEALASMEAALFGSPAPAPTCPDVFEVDAAAQGEEGLARVQAALDTDQPYALTFVDMRMPPGWDGLETIEHLWSVDPDLQVVICTAYSDYSWSEIVQRLGRTDRLLLLRKPFDQAEVWQMASALTEKWHLSRQARQQLDEAQGLVARTHDRWQAEMRERKSFEERLRYLAFHDPLTGLPNRAYLMERLGQCLGRAARHADYSFAVLFLDLDNFKLINDSMGHDIGDELLVEVATRLRNGLRDADAVVRSPEDAAARLGGDEFVVLLDNLRTPDDSARVAERLLEQIARPIRLREREVIVGASVGIAVSQLGYPKAEMMIRDADTAMYRAKAAGKARFAIFDPAMHAAARARLELEHDLHCGLEDGQFHLLYQPIVSLPDARVVSFEALIRWRHPTRGDVRPDEFIPVAEESGLIVSIGRWVVEEGCRQLGIWSAICPENAPPSLSVNISRRQLLDADFTAMLVNAMQQSGVSAPQLDLEITEGGIIGDPELVAGRLAEIKKLGVGLHMDDFGTGYSSLSCLHRFPLDVVKIDRSFTATMGSKREYAAVIQAIVTLAHNLNLRVTVEGVENAEQFAQITALGCDMAQGYLFMKPIDAEAAGVLLGRELGPVRAEACVATA